VTASMLARHLLPAGLLLAAGPAPAQPATPEGTPHAAAEPAAREAMRRDDATPILGRQVWDMDGGAVGRIVDVLVDGTGATRAVVVDAGGFMGIGQRRVAIAWHALRFVPEGKITLQLKAAQVAAMPEYKPAGNGPVVVAAPKVAAPPVPAPKVAVPQVAAPQVAAPQVAAPP
jgi:hypothetical protein